MRGRRVKPEVVSSWQAYIDLVASPALRNWAYRGHQDADAPLESSLGRYLREFVPDKKRWPKQEERGIRVFQRKAHVFVPAEDLADALHCVTRMQHHGSPTRLVDFTKSPFVAAFFALERATSRAVVWAVNTPALQQKIDLGPDRVPFGDHAAIDPGLGDNFYEYFVRNRVPFVWAGEPYRMNRRLVAQAGTYVVPGVLDRSIEEILATYPKSQVWLRKFVLAPKLRAEAMAALYSMNITQATLFPDLDGLARSIAYELETSWSDEANGKASARGRNPVS